MDGKHHMPDDSAQDSQSRRRVIPAGALVYLHTGYDPDQLISNRHDGTQRRESHLAVVR